MPFWPQNITDKHNLSDKVFVVRVAGTSDASTPLPYFKSRSDLIRLRNKVNNYIKLFLMINKKINIICLKK